MRHFTVGIALVLLLIGVGIRLWSPDNPDLSFPPDRQTFAAPSESDPSDEAPYLIRGQDPVKPPNLLRTTTSQPLPANPLRTAEQPIPVTIDQQAGGVQLAAGSAPSPFDFPAPPTTPSKTQSFDELPPPSQGSLLESAGFPPATESEPKPQPKKTPQPEQLPPLAPTPESQPLRATETRYSLEDSPAAAPLDNPFPESSSGFANTLEPRPLSSRQPEQPLLPIEGLSSITVGEPANPSPLLNADPFGEDSQTVAAPPPVQELQPIPNDSPSSFGSTAPTIANSPSARNPNDPGISNMEGTGTPGPVKLEGPQTPHITIEKVLPAEVVVDQPMVIKTVLRNVGRSLAKDIVLRDRAPQGTRLLSTSPEGTMTASGELVWSLGNLNANEQLSVEMRILPYREGEIGSVASVGYAAEASAKISVTRPMLRVEVKAPQEIQLGQTANLEITISNPGSATATGVVLTEYVPDGLYHKDGKILENKNIDTLKPKESKRLTLPLTCTGAGMLVNRLVVKANGGLIVEEETTIRALAPMLNLEIVGPKQRFLERKAGYRLVVSNPGTASARDVDLVVYLPPAVQFVSTNQSGVYEKSTHTVHWALEELPSQEAGEIELVVLPIKPGEHTIRFTGNGQSGLKAEEAQSLSIDGLAALSFEVACLSSLVEVGRDTVYEIRVSNRGTKSSGNVTVSAKLSEGMNFVAAEGPVRYNSNNGVVQFDPLAQLEAKGEKVYRITAKCLDDGDHRISVRVQSDELRIPITKEEGTRVFK